MSEKYWYGGVNNHQGQWDWDGVAPFTLDAGVATNEGTGKAGLPATAHGLNGGDEVLIAGTENYDGTFILDAATTANKLVIPRAFTHRSGTNGLVAGTQFTAANLNLTGEEVGMTLRLTSGTWPGDYAIVSVEDAGHLTFSGVPGGESGISFQIVRAETFDGTETVTPHLDSNWKLVADGSNAPKPVDGDVIHFNDRAYYVQSANKFQDCTINVNAAGTGTPNLAGVFVSAGFNGSIGSGAQPLEIHCDSHDIVVDGECKMYLKLSAGAGHDAGCGRLVVNNEKANIYVSSLLNNATNVCLYDLLICLKGYLWIQDNCAVREVVSANYSSFIDAGVGIENVKAGTLCSITAVKGEIVWRSKINELKLFDAKFAWGDKGMPDVVDYVCSLLTIYSKSGEFLWQMADTGESVIKQFVLYAGNLIASQSVNSGYKKKIGTGTEISQLWPDAIANLNSSSNNVLIADGSKLEAHGGTLIPSSGSLLEW